jgi:hypothetical protein
MKKSAWLLFFAFLFLCPLVVAEATTIDFVGVQYRQYDGGAVQNRFSFGGSPEGYPLDLSTFQYSIDPSGANLAIGGNPLSYTDLRFLNFQTINGSYAGNNTWTYDSSWETLHYYFANVDALPIGTYFVSVKDTQGNQLGAFDVYNGMTNLPIIDSSKLKYEFDASGNLYFSWAIPEGVPNNTYFVAYVDGILADNTFVSEITVRNPNYLDRVYFPKSILDGLGPVDYLNLSVNLRTDDQDTRSWSQSLRVERPVNIPEPGTIVLLGVGLFGVASYSRRKFKRS